MAVFAIASLTASAQALYWDINDNVAGAGGASPSGTWSTSGSIKNWGSSTGTINAAKWTDGRTAYFSAGSDATGSYTVTLGTAISAAGIVVEEGSPTFTGSFALSVSGNLAVATTSTVTFSNSATTITGDITGTGTVVKSGSGSLTLGSSVNFGGELTLSGGTVYLGGSTTISTLRITADSVIDFGSGAAMTLSVSTLIIEGSAKLTINNWVNAVDYFTATAFTGANVNIRGDPKAAQVIFSPAVNGSSTIWNGYDKQITPVPEPSTYGIVFLMLSTGGYAWHRRSKSSNRNRCCC